MISRQWTFLSNYGRVFIYIASHSEDTVQEIAQRSGLSLRAVQKIIDGLEADGYLSHQRVGRHNRYQVYSDLPMRHPLERRHRVGNLLVAFCSNGKNGQHLEQVKSL